MPNTQCAAIYSSSDPEIGKGRCQLVDGHDGRHSLIWNSQGQYRMLRTWTSNADVSDEATDYPRDRNVDSRRWAPGYPEPGPAK
jgi:hypothetical protein